MAKGPLLGEGRAAEVFAWGDAHILKLFLPSCAARAAHEARITRAVRAAGLPVPAVVELAEVEGRQGIIYERVDGPSMIERLMARPWGLFRGARALAALHAAVHERRLDGLPSLKEHLAEQIRAPGPLSAAERAAALRALDALPDGAALCHGDFHPDNVLMSPAGPVVVDWADATRGHPLGDVARTSLLLTTGVLPHITRRLWLIRLCRGLFHRLYLRHYFRLCPGSRGELRAWQFPLAAARLAECIPAERDRVMARVRDARSR